MSNYEKIFSTVGVNESGREGRSYIEGKDFEVNIAAPDSKQKMQPIQKNYSHWAILLASMVPCKLC